MNRTRVPEPDVPSILNAIYAFEVTDHSAWLAGVAAVAEKCVPHAMTAHSSLLRWRGNEAPDFIALAPRDHMTRRCVAPSPSPRSRAR
jgi:hypothetical protein